MSEGIALVCMRVVDMRRIHPYQDNSRFCSRCGERVGLYPSSQNAVRDNPGIKIICAHCADRDGDEADEVLPAAPLDEIVQEMRDSKDVSKA
jgi:hypothetical protein